MTTVKCEKQVKPTCTFLTLDKRALFLTLNQLYNVLLAFEVFGKAKYNLKIA